MKKQRQEKKSSFLPISYLLIVLMIAALTACGGGGGGTDEPGNPPPPSGPTTGTISGSVSGTIIVAVNDNGDIVASDDTTGKTADANGNYPFTLTGIPTGVNIRVYLITSTGVYPMYFDSNNDGTADTNVFSLSSAAAINLGYVDTSTGQAIPANNPITTTGVSAGAENTNTPAYLTSGTFYTSSGTYTYNSTTGILTINTTSTDSVCGTIGTENFTVTTFTATTMIMVDSNGKSWTWSRSSGNAGNPVGTWTTTIFNYLLVLTINSNTFTVVENSKCADASSVHFQLQGTDYYYVWFHVDDPTQQFTSVTVEGPNISGTLNLTYDSTDGMWEDSSIIYGTTPPPNLPLTYIFTLNNSTGTTTMTDNIETFVGPLPTNLSPSGGQTVSATPTFTWTGGGAGYIYEVTVSDSNGNEIWKSDFLTTTSVAYSGPTLTSGATYNYYVVIIDAYVNFSLASESFVVQ